MFEPLKFYCTYKHRFPYRRISTNCGVVSLSKGPLTTNLTFSACKLTLNSEVAPAPIEVSRISIALGVLSILEVTFTAQPILASSVILVVSVSAVHSGAVQDQMICEKNCLREFAIHVFGSNIITLKFGSKVY